jgi:hypothetical protein
MFGGYPDSSLKVYRFSSSNTSGSHDIAENLLKVTINASDPLIDPESNRIRLSCLGQKVGTSSKHLVLRLMFFMLCTCIIYLFVFLKTASVYVVIASVQVSNAEDRVRGLNTGRVKPKTMKLVFVALWRMIKDGWLRIRIMCSRGATYGSMDCYFSELALYKKKILLLV